MPPDSMILNVINKFQLIKLSKDVGARKPAEKYRELLAAALHKKHECLSTSQLATANSINRRAFLQPRKKVHTPQRLTFLNRRQSAREKWIHDWNAGASGQHFGD